MIKLYLKQAWALLKQNPLFSTLYIAGTGLAIAMTMIVAVIYYVRLAPLYPEYKRGCTLYMPYVKFSMDNPDGGWGYYTGGFSHQALADWVYTLPGAEVVSAQNYYGLGTTYVQLSGGRQDEEVKALLTDPAFFRLYTFRFVDGAPFTQADMDGGVPHAVITSRLARMLFDYGSDGVVGRTFRMNLKEYTVCGVVEAASRLMENSFADVYLPYSIMPDYRDLSNPELPDYGFFSVTIAAKDRASMDTVRRAVNDYVRRFNALHEKDYWTMSLDDAFCSHAGQVLQRSTGSDGNISQGVRHLLLVIMVLLLVPALNLSGLIASRMEARLPEMGVRKTFGAWRTTLLGMVMWENLLLTLLGGILGLLLAWMALYLWRGWVFNILDSYAMQLSAADVTVSGEMLFAPLVFACTLLLCIVLNVLSAFIPAWWSLRHPIVQSLYEKR